MCGIVGARHDWLVATGRDPAMAMRDAVAALAWRGPDGQGVVRAGDWWLGCARLAIGPARSKQPVVRRGGRFVGVMNGAITNARELWAHFLPGVERRAELPNDAWLPLLAVERGEDQILGRLRGHHAFAVVDTQTGQLITGRDWYGEKPLLQALENLNGSRCLVAFASSPTALRLVGGAPPFVPGRLPEWFRFGWMRRKEPWLAGATPQGLVQLGFARRIKPEVADLRTALLASVARCSDTRVPVALSLSGGLDSSCLAVALHANGKRVPAYQLRAAGAPATEREAARAIAARTRLDLRPVDIDQQALAALPFLTACAGLPLGDPSILLVHALARAAAADGIRVLLSGEGADELFLGYRRYRALARLPHATWLRALAPRWSMRYGARMVRAITAPDPATALLAVTPPAFGSHVLAPDLAARRCWRDEARSPVRPGQDPVLAARDADLDGYLRFDLLPKIDVACMAAGVEARAPFLEGDCRWFGQDRTALGKRPLREAFANDLPPEVLRLPKTGFALPLDRWFRGELPWLDLLREPTTCNRPHLRPGGVARAIDLHRSGKVDLGHALYLLVAYETWLRSPAGNTDSVRTGAHDHS
ncbi:MAG: asparagine synthetase B [Planctomycetes bacterium]|nr:asparagine synthetase B [Planctomycetota bacterium]